jgi:arylsulfatase A-like enzyme
VLISVAASCGGEFQRPNILLVSIDSLRSDHLSSYGYERETSPCIDRLASEGVRFETAVSSASWTLPAHVTLLTGLPAEYHGVRRVPLALAPDAVTLAEVLHDGGYATAGFVSGPFLNQIHGYSQGFELYDSEASAPTNLESHRTITSPELVRRVNAWLRDWSRSDRRRPFFLFLHMWDVHYDYVPPPPYDTLFDPDYDGSIDGRNFDRSPDIRAGMDRRDLDHVIALYDGEIRYTDEHLEKILAAIRELGVERDKIAVVTSDHGEEFFEHGKKGHGKTLFEETVRVPLVLRYPRRVPAGQVVRSQVRLMDVAPTILGLARVETQAGFLSSVAEPARARDLSPWLTGGAEEPFPELFAFSESALVPSDGIQRSVRSHRAKYISHVVGRERQAMVFDLTQDPGERQDLAGRDQLPSFARELVRAGMQFDSALRQRPNLVRRVRFTRDHVEGLRALGYIE